MACRGSGGLDCIHGYYGDSYGRDVESDDVENDGRDEASGGGRPCCMAFLTLINKYRGRGVYSCVSIGLDHR
jgi:hypothetical protein